MTIPRIATYAMPTVMPKNRVDWLPNPQRAALLIHDMQQYFLDFYDVTAAPVPTLIANLRALRDRCDALGIPVYYTAQPAVQSAEHRGLLQDWWGPGLTAKPERQPVIDELAPREQDTVLVKWRYSAFTKTPLLQMLKEQGRDQLIVGGVYAQIGCLMTCADAFMNDIQPFLVGDAVADFCAADQQLGLDYVAQRCGVVIDTQTVLTALAPSATETLPATKDELHFEVAALLSMPVAELFLDDNLLYSGLDSIRLMSLVTRWRAAGADLQFIDLAESPTLNDWWALLSAQSASSKPAAATSLNTSSLETVA